MRTQISRAAKSRQQAAQKIASEKAATEARVKAWVREDAKLYSAAQAAVKAQIKKLAQAWHQTIDEAVANKQFEVTIELGGSSPNDREKFASLRAKAEAAEKLLASEGYRVKQLRRSAGLGQNADGETFAPSDPNVYLSVNVSWETNPK